MDVIRGIPNRYLHFACLALSFLLFSAGGTAFSQSPFYGSVFIILAVVLVFAGARIGNRDPPGQDPGDD